MNSYNLFFILFLTCFFSYSQIKISGVVKDSENQPLAFANVIVKLQSDNTLLSADITNELGEFNMSVKTKEPFEIFISYIGFEEWKKEITTIQNIDLGVITLIQTDNNLEEVFISTKKPLIQKKADRLIFNVENSIVSQGVDAMEVLQRTPRIDISNGGVKIIGKSKLSIMLDGRMLNLSGSDLEAYLRTIRSDNISKIEVITIPPAKYDAEGNSGIINIITKKNPDQGWDGSIGTTYIQRTYAALIPTSNLKFANERLNVLLNISADTEAKASTANTKIEYPTKYWNTLRNRKDSSKGLMVNLNSNYKLTSKSEIGFIYSASFWEINQRSRNLSHFIQKETLALDSTLTTSINNNNKYDFHSINGYYDLKLDTIGKKLTLNIDYLKKGSSNDRTFNTNNFSEDSNIFVLDNSNNKYEVASLKTDFILPYDDFDLEVGGKFTYINNASSLLYYDVILDRPIINYNRSNRFEYEEKTTALYFSIEKEFSEKWIAQVGLRFENTYLRGFSPTLNQTNTNNLNNLFPSAYISYDLNENNSLSLAYSKRIDRPGFSNLNPFRIYSDPYSYDAGNPFLLPSITHNFELSYILKNNLSLTIYGSKLINVIDFITRTNTSLNAIISQPENLYNQYNSGLDISHKYDPFRWFDSYNSVSAYFNQSNSNFENETLESYKGYGTYISTKNTFTFNENKTTFLTINFFQSFPNVDGFFQSKSRASLDVGLKFKLLDKKLQVNVSGNDLFRQNRNVGYERYQNFSQYSKIYNDMRNFTLSLTYKIGKKEISSRHRGSYNEDMQRIN